MSAAAGQRGPHHTEQRGVAAMGVQRSHDGWTRFSNSSGNCVEARWAAGAREIEIRESECPGHVIAVTDYAWYGFLMAIKAGLYKPLVIADMGVVVSVGEGEANKFETTLPKWESFVEGVQLGA